MATILIRTDTRYPVNRKVIRKAVSDTLLKHRSSDISAEVSVSVVGERKMLQLSKTYLKDDEKHEVLSFSFEDVASGADRGFISPPDGILRLGDVVLCWPQVLLAAARDGVMVDDEVYFLTCHSVEHLLGKHHE